MFGAGYTRVVDAAQPLLDTARQAEVIDTSLTLEQILDLIIAVAKISGADSYRAPILDEVLKAERDPLSLSLPFH